MKIKTILKCTTWAVALIVLSLAIVYGFWLMLIFWLFSETAWLLLTIGGELVMIAVWILLVRLAEC